MMTSSDDPTIIAVVWTYNRFELACRCIEAVLDQSRPADRVIVVDSASPDGSGSRLRDAFTEVEVIELPDNGGPGAAISAAFATVGDQLPDYFWLVEDDSFPQENCLEMAVEQAAQIDQLGILGPVGCMIKRGQWRATSELPPGESRAVDFVVLDGSLVSGEAVRESGYPKTDYFLMMVDVEYPLRMARGGFAMVQVGLPYRQLRLGAAAEGHSWRNYYQTRNHLRMAIEFRSATLLGGFALRSLKHLGYALGHKDWVSVRYRTRGVVDALRGRMGRIVEPPAPPTA
jgi:rhamnopyranosyl-N-acetylglucosaminyl-diphospho-decaprenol beta-1,3/1,4-galactofuranosyltransferase